MLEKNRRGVRALVIALALVALAGCEKKSDGSFAMSDASGGSARTLAAAAMAPGAAAQPRTNSLAYEHTISIETTKEALPARLREIEAACRADQTSGCTILDVSSHAQDDLPNGSIRMRLAPTGVEPIVAVASKDGKVIGRSTHAEDLAEPIADTERQLALLTLHRDRLAELMKSKDIKIDQLITVSRELASVQSQLDSLGSQRANLRRRVDTELLTIQLSLPRHDYAANNTPVTDAFRDFGSDFREAIGMVIRFFAVLLPWLVVVLPGIFLLRLFWRWIGRLLTRRER